MRSIECASIMRGWEGRTEGGGGIVRGGSVNEGEDGEKKVGKEGHEEGKEGHEEEKRVRKSACWT